MPCLSRGDITSTVCTLLLVAFAGGFAAATYVLHKKLNDLQKQINKTRPQKPKYIVLMRHGESEANVDHTLYSSVGDPNISLTTRGAQQAKEAGQRLAKIIEAREIFCYISPYIRTKQTAEFLLSQLSSGTIHKQIFDPRLREREFSGTFQPIEGLDRDDEHAYSRFFWRPPCGESCADVYDRVSLFIDTLWRDFKRHPEMKDSVVLLVSHGLTTRLFLMRWLHWSIETFNSTKNPDNCDMLIMEKNQDGYFELHEESLKVLGIEKTFAEMRQESPRGLRPVPDFENVNAAFELKRKHSRVYSSRAFKANKSNESKKTPEDNSEISPSLIDLHVLNEHHTDISSTEDNESYLHEDSLGSLLERPS